MTTRIIVCIAAVLSIGIAIVVEASSVADVDFDQLVASSEFIFQGHVVAKRAEIDGPRIIHTYVTFAVDDVLKGTYAERTIILRYLGGAADGVTLHVSDLTLPDQGEKGVYFVESLKRPQVHPLYGWDQGRFLIVRDALTNTDRIVTHKGLPITGFLRPLRGNARTTLSVGKPNRIDEAISIQAFKKTIIDLKSRP